MLKINFVGSTTTGYIGEVSDETHLVRELRNLGHEVNFVPRDQWKAFVDGQKPNDDWVLPIEADINILCKWHHFNDPKYIGELYLRSNAPVFYWVWDFMRREDWHMKLVKACNLYISNDVYSGDYDGMDNCHYFPFDVADGSLPVEEMWNKTYDVVFFGSYLLRGDRVEWLREINKTHPVKVFSWNYQKWQEDGFDASPAVYGEEFCRAIAQSRIVLQFSVNDHCWGYWSNRVGKVLTTGGFLLTRYAPGMELFLRDGVEYFSSIEEANKKIAYYLEHEDERNKIAKRGFEIGRDRFTSAKRVKELEVLIYRYLSHEL